MFGFTGTPIFADNAVGNAFGKRTTKELFDECLHKYVITNAIKDENVLKFSIEYLGRYKQKDGSEFDIDIAVEDIDTKELLESPKLMDKIVDYILAHHGRKTYNREFTAIFCVSSVETLIKYYEIFKAKKAEGKHDMRVATIFTFAANEDDKDADGLIGESDIAEDAPINKHSRDILEMCIADYNAMYNTKFSTKDSQSFYNYYKDIAKRIKEREKDTFQDKDRVDILLVVNMFLTGFDAKKMNTLYVDKNLKHHGLIQAFSRTNRIFNEVKAYGNIVCFRNLKKATDDAIALFSNPETKEVILMEPYEAYVRQFNQTFAKLLTLAPTVDSMDELPSEVEELEFVTAFRELMRLKNLLNGFSDFSFTDLAMNEQAFEDYKSKYLDIHDKFKSLGQKEKVSVLDDVDFELELIHRDEINETYILKLLARLVETDAGDRDKQRKAILDLLGGEVQLRSKRELIEKFILENLPQLDDVKALPEAFETYWNLAREKALLTLALEEKLDPGLLHTAVENYLFTQRPPLREEVVHLMREKPKLLERKPLAERVLGKIMDLVGMFYEGL